MVVGAQDAQVSHLVSVVWQPGCAGHFESGLEHMAVTAFDQARTNRQAQRQCQWIVRQSRRLLR